MLRSALKLFILLPILLNSLFISQGSAATIDGLINIAKLRAVPEQIKIRGEEYNLRVYLRLRHQLYYGFFDEYIGGEFDIGISITAIRLSEFPPFLDANRLWVIADQGIMEIDLKKVIPKQQRIFRNVLIQDLSGTAEWVHKGTVVDVVVEIIDKERNRKYLLKAPKLMVKESLPTG